MNLIEQAKDMGAEVISLSGGDPLMYGHWKTLVEFISHHEMDILFYTCGFWRDIYDGGQTITGEDLTFLARSFKNTKSRLILSLEGATAETHNKMFGHGNAFKILTEMIIPTAVNLGLLVELHFTPTAINIHEVTTFLDLAEELEVEKVSFLRLVPQGRAEINRDQLMLTPEQFLELQITLHDYKGKVPFRIGCPLNFGHLLGYIDERPKCHAGQDLLLVRPDGEAHCCAGWKNCKSLSLGNIKDMSLRDIWQNSVVLQEIRDFNETKAVGGFCSDCPWMAKCGGGCPAQRVILNQFIGVRDAHKQLFGGVDPACPRFNDLIADFDILGLRKELKTK
jgi:radical SAM protein with 4Fe4S-binding SPASM domain